MSDILLSFILGIIQGLTEFLPISSSAHLLLPSLIFGVTDLGLSFDIAVHAGTLLAVVYYFKKEILLMTKSIYSKEKELDDHRKLLLMLVIGTLPIIIAGLGFSNMISERIFNLSSIAYSNLIFAAILLFAYLGRSENLKMYDVTFKAALIIGLFQCIALIPGASRSGTAITGALIVGLNMRDASKFAFLLSIPTILGAIVFLISDFNNYDFINITTLIGFVASFIFAFLTIKYFLSFVEKIGMIPFVIYRIILGLTLLVLI